METIEVSQGVYVQTPGAGIGTEVYTDDYGRWMATRDPDPDTVLRVAGHLGQSAAPPNVQQETT